MNPLTSLERFDDMSPQLFRRFMQPMRLDLESMTSRNRLIAIQ